MKGLQDMDDDVRSVSAATLIPMAKEFVTMRPGALDELINIVWESLSNLGDENAASKTAPAGCCVRNRWGSDPGAVFKHSLLRTEQL